MEMNYNFNAFYEKKRLSTGFYNFVVFERLQMRYKMYEWAMQTISTNATVKSFSKLQVKLVYALQQVAIACWVSMNEHKWLVDCWIKMKFQKWNNKLTPKKTVLWKFMFDFYICFVLIFGYFIFVLFD